MIFLSYQLHNTNIFRWMLCLVPVLTAHNIQDTYNSENNKHPKLWVIFFSKFKDLKGFEFNEVQKIKRKNARVTYGFEAVLWN